MTKKQEAFKKSLIKQVHLSKRYQNYYKEEQEEYRELLKNHFGVSSSKDLNIKQLIALVEYFNYDIPELPIIRDRSKDATKRQIALLRHLWKSYARDKSDRALLYFIKRVAGTLYISLDVISKGDIAKAIVALKKNVKEKR